MSYVVRGENGITFTDTLIGENQEVEVEYESYDEAEKAKEELQKAFKDIELKVINQ